MCDTPASRVRVALSSSVRQLLRRTLFWVGTRLLARTALQPLNRLLFETSLRGMGLLNYRDMHVSGESWLLEQLSRAWSESRQLVRPTVVDVGANDGSYTAAVLEALPNADVHAFEPHPRTADRLERRMGGSITVVRAAVGSTSGTLELFDYEDADGSSHASPYQQVFTEIHRRPVKSLTVPVVQLDEYLREEGLTDVLLLKVDTEGHELEVIRGALEGLSTGSVHCLQFEFNEMNVISRTFLRDFRELLPGFEFFRLLPQGVVPLRGEPLEELFAFQNIVAAWSSSPVCRRLLSAQQSASA